MDLYIKENPYKHALMAPVFSVDTEFSLINLLDSFAWERRASDFYRFDVPCAAEEKKSVLEMLLNIGDLRIHRVALEHIFGVRLEALPRLEIHRYTQDCGIGPHTDAGLPEVRVVVNLNRNWNRSDGGIWILSTDSALRLPAYLPSISNTGFAFATSIQTYHALSILENGITYGLTIRFSRSHSGLDA